MTWKEVKEQIEENGVTDEMEMWYIDISFDRDISVSPQNEETNQVGFYVFN